MKKLFIPLVVFIGISITASAQEKSNIESKDNKNTNSSIEKSHYSHKEIKGNKYDFNYSFDKAIYAYTHTKNLSVEGQRNLAESYHNIGQNIQSEAVYLKLINAQIGILPEDYYNYAMVLKADGKYDEANKWMARFIELKPDDLRVKDYTANKDELPNLLKDNGKYKINHLDVNTDADDFGTCYYKDKIVFASSRSNSKMIVKKYNWTGKPFFDMYVSDVDKGQLKTPENFNKKLNGTLHDGPASFSNNGTFMAFTRNNYDAKRKDKVVNLQIYFSSFKDGVWSDPVPFILNNMNYSVGQPCLTSDGNTMYFASDMPGGFGGADIYRIRKDTKGEWGKPENLGDKINTEGDEMFPFYEETNKILFFSSNGRFGLGGLDIFTSSADSSGFDLAVNAGSPLNTQYDDYAAIVDGKANKGYFSSNRTGGSGGEDIYSFDILKAFDNNNSDVLFFINAPTNIPVDRRVREIFPLRNYIFFDLGSTEIPDRYVLLNKDQVKDFKEDQLEVFTPKKLSGRSVRQMIVYYNVLNILGDRMGKNHSATIKLVGSSEKGPGDGKLMAESVKQYLVNVFGIDTSRIGIEGRYLPKIPSEQPGNTEELDLLREGDRRVSIESSTPILLMEFQSGPDAPLKPVELVSVLEAPLDGYISFNVDGGKDTISSWTMEIKDENKKVQNFGPYIMEKISMPGQFILGARSECNYIVTMTGTTKSGRTVKKSAPLHLQMMSPTKNEEMMRFSILFEFNDSKAIKIYEKYLTDVIIPKIPKGGKVIISGYTDIIGTEENNYKLSVARALDAKKIFENGLAKAGRSDVKFDVFGFGEYLDFAPFDNKYPEGRFYNRTVIIDIIPQ